MKKYYYYIAIAGLTIGAIVHLISLAGINLQSEFPFMIVLHVGVFVVWIPAVLEMNKRQAQATSGKKRLISPFKTFEVVFKNIPTWMVVMVVVFFFYAVVNFLLFMASTGGGGPSIVDGKYVLQNHGQLIRGLTFEEYNKFQANEVRGFSGHWMAFYAMAMAVLHPVQDKASDS